MAKAYLITNPSGNTSGVTSRQYDYFAAQEGYTGHIVGDDGDQPAEPESSPDPDLESAYPKHTGGGWYELSDGSKVQGKQKARQAETRLKAEFDG